MGHPGDAVAVRVISETPLKVTKIVDQVAVSHITPRGLAVEPEGVLQIG